MRRSGSVTRSAGRRPQRRTRSLFGVVAALLVAAVLPSAVNAALADAAEDGVRYAVYDGYWTSLPDFSAESPATTGTTASFDLSVRGAREDGFGIRFESCLTVPTAGTWTFTTRSDDGSTLYLNGAQLVDNDGLHAAQDRSGTVTLAAGTYPIVVDYHEYGGGETLEVYWQGPGVSSQLVPSNALSDAACPATGTSPESSGAAVDYSVYDGYWASVPDFGSLTPAATGQTGTFGLSVRGSRQDGFGIRFTSCITLPAAGTWTFTTRSDDGSLLRLNGQGLVDNNGLHAPQDRSGSIELAAGTYPIVVDYVEYGGGQTLEVYWEGPGVGREEVPASALTDVDCPPVPGGGPPPGTGVDYAIYDGFWGGLPDFGSMTPAATGATGRFDLSVRGSRADGFGIRFSSCVTIPTAGTWTFATRSDDGSKLYLDDSLLVDNDGLHAPQDRSGSRLLAAGGHPIVVDYHEYGGGETLEVSWQGPGVAFSQVPASALSSDCAGPPPGGGVTNEPPSLASPGPQSSVVGTAVTLQATASDPEGDTLSFSASGLPPGLGVDGPTGTISGVPSEAGTYSVTLTVADAGNSVPVSFSWTVDPRPAGPGVFTVAGRRDPSSRGDSGDGGPATSARLLWAHDVAVDGSGNIYIADMQAHRVRRVDAQTGIISTVLGTGVAGYSGDGGPGVQATLNSPINLTVAPDGDVLVADWNNHAVRRLDVATGTVTTVAGRGVQAYWGDGGPATSAYLNYPEGIDLDAAGNLFIADFGNNRVRRVDAATGIITTVAGNGAQDSTGNGGPATSASFNGPTDVELDGSGNLYITDYYGNQLRFVSASTGVITAFAGDGTNAFGGDGGPATSAQIARAGAVSLDLDRGHVYVLDRDNGRIRRVDTATGTISTVAGGGADTAEGAGALDAEMWASGMWFDRPSGTLYFAEPYFGAVRKIVGLAG